MNLTLKDLDRIIEQTGYSNRYKHLEKQLTDIIQSHYPRMKIWLEKIFVRGRLECPPNGEIQ
jgi:hypothetical protein